jgi:hypothetical protein
VAGDATSNEECDVSAQPEERPVTGDEIYVAVHRVRDRNPHDGRTVAGRAWSDGAWEVMQEIKSLWDGKWSA